MGGMLRGIDGLSDKDMGGIALTGDDAFAGAACGLVSRAGASMYGGGTEEDAVGAATEVVGACAVSTRLSIDGGMGGGGGNEAFGRSEGVVEGAVW
jgi:hypothetical protein